MKFFRPRWVFLFYLTSCIVFIAPSITQRGNAGMAMLFVTLFFESICFPTIVALGMRGLGKHTKRGSGFIVAGVAGGAVVPPLLGAAADLNNSTGKAMGVPLGFFVGAWTYALCVNFAPSYRDTADKFHTAEIGLTEGAKDEEDLSGSGNVDGEKAASVERRENVHAAAEIEKI